MSFFRSRALSALPLLLTGLLWFGCKKPFQAEVPGLENKTDVPANAVIHIRYEGTNWIAKKYLKRGNFQLSNCVSQEKKETRAEDESAGKAEPAKEGEKTTEPKETRAVVPSFMFVNRTHKNTDAGLKRVTDVYLFPYSDTSEGTPLVAGQTYCLDVQDVAAEGADRETALGTSITFQVDEKDDFEFSDGEGLRVSSFGDAGSVRSDDALLVEFADPVNPSELQKGTYLCNRSAGNETSSGVCESDGTSETKQLYLLEDLTEESDGYIRSRFNLFAFEGGPTFKPHSDYVLKLGVTAKTEKGEKRRPVERIEFTPDGKPKTGESADPAEGKAEGQDEATPAPESDSKSQPTARQKALVKKLQQTSDPAKDPSQVIWIPIDPTT